MPSLHSLPPELLVQVLSSTDSPTALFSLVAASSACFRTYSLYQRSILGQVLSNSLSPQLIRELLAIASLSHGIPNDGPGPFVERYFSAEPFDIPSDSIDIASARQAYTAVDRLTQMYFTYTSARLMSFDQASHPEEQPPEFIPLSAAEKDRIQRAFYRYELYSRLFPASEHESGGSDYAGSAATQFHLFLRRMTPWELEELSCVHLFLVTLIAGFIEDLEDEVFEAVLTCPDVCGAESAECGRPCPWSLSQDLDRVTVGPRRVVLPTSSSSFLAHRKRKRSPTRPLYPSRYRPFNDIPKGHVSFSSLDDYSLEMFGQRFQQNARSRFIGRLASLGLGFILKLIDAPSPAQTRLLIQSQPSVANRRPFLPEALDLRPTRTNRLQRQDDNDGIDVRDGPTREDQRVPAFLFVNRGEDYIKIHHPAASGDVKWDCLRAIGYLFWDKARWQGPNAQRVMVMSWNLAQMASRREQQGGRHTSWSRFLSRRPSVEERLRGVSISAEAMRRIARVYGRMGPATNHDVAVS